jgi:hypothetical protein
MIRVVCRDEVFLAQKGEPATPADLAVARNAGHISRSQGQLRGYGSQHDRCEQAYHRL